MSFMLFMVKTGFGCCTRLIAIRVAPPEDDTPPRLCVSARGRFWSVAGVVDQTALRYE